MEILLLFASSTSFAKASAARWNKNAVNAKKGKGKREKNRKDRNNWREFAGKKKKRSAGAKRKRLAEEERRGKLKRERNKERKLWCLLKLRG